MAALGALGIVILIQAVTDLLSGPAQDRALLVLNAVAGWGLLLAAVCVAHNGRRMRMIGWLTLGALISGPTVLGLLTATGTVKGIQASVWADGGRALWYLPLVLPVVAAVWMWFSDPRRIVATAELMDGLGQSWAEGRSARVRDDEDPGDPGQLPGGSPTAAH